jgi:hypothetical protein
MLIASLAVIVGAGIYLLTFFQSQPEPGGAVATLMPLVCTDCGKVFARETRLDDLPTKCCFCSGQVYRAAYCVECKMVVPMRDSLEAVECPECPDSRRTLDVPIDLMEECP